MRRLLVAYVLSNAVLYSVLLPLWEGFDEPFHFGYVQQLANGAGLPNALTATLSAEVGASLRLAPVSYLVQRNLRQVPAIVSYSEYFAWPAAKREDFRERLYAIPPDLRGQPSEFNNYEAQQAPLGYMPLAIPERLLSRVPLPARVLILRMMAGITSAILLLVAARKLYSQLQIPHPYDSLALFCVFSSQMLWATIAHVSNDWLAIPLAVWMLVASISYNARPGVRSAAIAALVLSLGLLTKAYFLAFVPLVLGVCAMRGRWRHLLIAAAILCGVAGPWYVRNAVVYGSFSGTQEARAGIGPSAVLEAAPHLNWLRLVWSSMRAAIWTGNNSFLTFSVTTLNVAIVACLIAMLLWAASRHTPPEWIATAYSALFVVAIAYTTVVSYAYTGIAAEAVGPWYAQTLPVPAFGLMLLGVSRWRSLGRFLAAALALLFGYVLAVTYPVKLIPLYAGYEGRITFPEILQLYVHQATKLMDNLNTIMLAPPALILSLAFVVVALVVAQEILLVGTVFARRGTSTH
jgi:hypothetical protein